MVKMGEREGERASYLKPTITTSRPPWFTAAAAAIVSSSSTIPMQRVGAVATAYFNV